nr:8-oxo-dGTP diphosphatase [Planococcus halocryophilus]
MKRVYNRCGVSNVQRIANLLVIKNGQVLLLKKPRRDWYVAPGGKMEPGESIFEAAVREFTEETNATPIGTHLKGVYTMMIQEQGKTVNEWMMYTFAANDLTGDLFKETPEGILEWHPVEALATLPMAEGDRTNLQFVANQQGVQYGTFYYTPEFQLIKENIQSSIEEVNHPNE